MATRPGDRHLAAAFLVGVASGPVALALAWTWLALSPSPACRGLCFSGLGEALVSAVVAAFGCGIVARFLGRDLGGWLAMLGGIVAVVMVGAALGPGSSGYSDTAIVFVTALFAVPASVGYLVAAGLGWLTRPTT